MSGSDLLDGGTGTSPSPVSQRSESGEGILGVEEGRDMWLWSVVVVSVLSSHMSADGCSLVGHRDNVVCLVYKFVYYESRKRNLKTRLICEYRCDERLKN